MLAHVCRRGGIDGRDVGAIRLQSHTSTFEIQTAVAKDFEARVRGRDRRDPHLQIRRTRAGGRAPRSDFARS
jgi:hypothetical protein